MTTITLNLTKLQTQLAIDAIITDLEDYARLIKEADKTIKDDLDPKATWLAFQQKTMYKHTGYRLLDIFYQLASYTLDEQKCHDFETGSSSKSKYQLPFYNSDLTDDDFFELQMIFEEKPYTTKDDPKVRLWAKHVEDKRL